MGVYGLWKLIEPSGKPVPLDTLENKVLAVDVSIWLHQAIKGFQDSKGGSVPNAHLLGIYHRVCKLLYYKIKPVFVFDGGVPALKKQTIAKRQQLKCKNVNQAASIQQKLISTLLKHSAVTKVLSERTRAELEQQSALSNTDKESNIYALPPSKLDSSLSDEDAVGSSDETVSSSPSKTWDLHTIDVKSTKFKSLPSETRHEILTELKETRKQNSWGRLHELPTQSDEFSGFQMNRLLNRYSVQVSLEEVEKEMGGHSLSLKELESLLKDTGVICNNDVGKQIASDENQKILFIKNVQDALKIAKEIDERNANKSEELESSAVKESTLKGQDELEQDLQKAIKLSLYDQPSSSKQATEDEVLYFSSSEEDDTFEINSTLDSDEASQVASSLSSAKNYMTEYTGLTPSEINNILNRESHQNKTTREKCKNVLRVQETESSKICKSPRENVTFNADAEVEMQKAIEESIKDMGLVPKDIEGTLSKSSDFLGESVVAVTSSLSKEILTEEPKGSSNEIETAVTRNVNTDTIVDDDSDSSDFVEVEESIVKVSDESGLQVVLNRNESFRIEDDLFKDVFNNENVSNRKLETHIKDIGPVKKDNRDQHGEVFLDENTYLAVNGDIMSDNFAAGSDKEKQILLGQDEPSNKISGNNHENVDAQVKAMVNSVQCDGNSTLSKNQLEELKDKMAQEKKTLYSERVSKERLAENISQQMCTDAQELLQLFGVPYIVAPMEAEAQCAFLETIGLTDGSITDDSDIWLFGGKTVYKNFFNQSKHVLEFTSENIEHHFRLSREQLILLAMLVGSDYTTGVPGVGPVTALEILAAFPVSKNITFSQIARSPNQILSGLASFRKWYINGGIAVPQKAALRTKLKNCTITEGFPNFQILNAYLQPEIDTSEDKFSWAKPDDVALIDFARSKFGWTSGKAEEILNPVLKRLSDSKVQKSVKDYFKTKHKLIDRTETAQKMSKRVRRAIDKLDGISSESDEELQILQQTKAISKRKTDAINKDIRAQIDKASNTKVSKSKEPKKPHPSTKIRFERSTDPTLPKVIKPNLHKIDLVYQKEMAKNGLLQNKLKAIEAFRKSKAGPGYVKKRKMIKKKLKDKAELSESSDNN